MSGRLPLCWPETLAVLAWLIGVFLVFRVSAFRTDNEGPQRYFGMPYLLNLRYLTRANFKPEGQRYLSWLWFDTSVFALGVLLSMITCI
jgi:hypothetical protein